MSYSLYGRLQGRGRELTASGSKDSGISTQVETRDAAIRVTLRANGNAVIEVGRKRSDTARPDRWQVLDDVNIDQLAAEPALA